MQILSQALAKQIRLLQQKKFRDKEKLFLAEGAKPVIELLQSDWKIKYLIGTATFFERPGLPSDRFPDGTFEVSEKNLSSIGSLETNRDALAVVEMPGNAKLPNPDLPLWLVLDQLSDPGNLGTIIRLADWFGLPEIITTGQTVEWYNPKVINASMGSFLRVRQVKSDAETILPSGRAVYTAEMGGQSLYEFRLPGKPMVLVIGQESHGISAAWKKAGTQALSIPRFGEAESLNAAMATGILLNHWRSLLHSGNPALLGRLRF
jgi:TrmH family RNA methyltransferase